MHNKIFISYAKEDINFAEKLYSFLEENDFYPWLDKKDLLPGQDWNLIITKTLREADYIIVLLSHNSVQKRGYVQREFKLALDYYEEKLDDDIYLIPLKINNCEIPLKLSKFQWIDYDENDSFEKILKSLNLQRKKLLDYDHKIDGIRKFKNSPNKKVFKIELSREFESMQSDIILADYFTQIKDLHNDGKSYEIEFEIEYISEIYRKYEELKKIENPIENDLKLKQQYRRFLDACFYYGKETIYDKLKEVVENIIIYSYNKYAYIREIDEVVIAVKNSINYFDPNPKFKSGKGFDIFEDQNNWNFKIYLNENEVLKLLSIFNVQNSSISDKYILLSRVGGLDVYDLNHETLIREAIPKQAFAYVYNNISREKKDEYFKIGNWKLGLA